MSHIFRRILLFQVRKYLLLRILPTYSSYPNDLVFFDVLIANGTLGPARSGVEGAASTVVLTTYLDVDIFVWEVYGENTLTSLLRGRGSFEDDTGEECPGEYACSSFLPRSGDGAGGGLPF